MHGSSSAGLYRAIYIHHTNTAINGITIISTFTLQQFALYKTNFSTFYLQLYTKHTCNVATNSSRKKNNKTT